MDNKQNGLQKQQTKTPSLESLEQASPNSNATSVNSFKNSRDSFASIQKRPTRLWKKQAALLLVSLIFLGGLGFAALRLNAKISNGSQNQDLAGSFKPVGNPVLGAESILPVQSLNDKTVTINGDLTVNGKLKLSAEAIQDLAGVVGNKVNLSPTIGGPVQTGNILISGSILASNFQGNGSNLSNLNASSIASGTLSNDRLDASVTRLGQTIPLSALQSTVLSSLNGISNNGNVDIVAGTGISVTTDTNTNQIVLSASAAAGDITGVIAGTGLTGGGTTGDVTLNIDTGLVTVQGNTFNGANQLIKLNGAGELPVISATNLTNLNASNIGTGTVSDSRLSSNVTLQGNTFNLPSKLVQLDSSGNLPALNASALTNLSASGIATGTVADARLSANVALLNANQTFSGNVVFSQPLSVNVIQPSAAMTIGATNQTLTLQGDLSSKLTATGGTGSVSLGFTGTPTGTVVYNLDAATTPGTYTLCTTVGNCVSAGGGVTTLGGTTNKLAKFTGGQAIGDSSISDTGTLVTIGATGLYKASADSTTAFRVQNAAGSSNVFTADTTNNRVAIGQATASYTLDVNGDINSATALRVGGNLVCDSNGCAASGQSGFYIQNGSTTQTAANFNIESTSTSAPTAVLKLKSGQSADLLQARDDSNAVIAKIDASGNISTTGQFQVSGTQISSANLSNDANLAKLDGTQTFTAANLFRNAGDSTTAFRIQNAAASNLFVADTSNTRVAIGQATAGYTLDVNGDINITNGSSYRINGVAICGPTATCAPSSGSGSYVQNGLTVQTANMNIQSSNSSAVVAILQGATGQTADILQARDSNDNVVAKITAAGAIYQGANQVCDTSNNCGYANGSGSGNYIQNGTTTQTANLNIQSASASQTTAVIQGANAQTANILEVKDGTAQGNTLFSVNQTTQNLISNSSFDTNLTGLTTRLSTSSVVNTTERYIGAGSAQLGVAANGDGVNFAYPLASSTAYTLSFYMKASASTSMQIGRADDGNTESSCVAFTATTNWQRYSCSFTTGTASGSPFVYIRTVAGSARTLYLDAVQLETGSTATAYQQGQISLNGVINSPTTFRNQSDSSTAILIQNAAGVNQFAFDTVNNVLTNTSGSNTAKFGSSSVGVVNAAGYGTQINTSGVTADFNLQLKTVNAASTALHFDNTNNVPILNIDTLNVANLLTNPSYDGAPTGTTALGSSTVARTTVDQYSGAGALSVTTTAAANVGAKIAYALASTTTYSFSVYARATGANFSTFQLGYSPDGTTITSCLSSQTVLTTGWTRYSCSFTTGTVGGAANARYVYVRQTDATARTFYMDAVQLEISSAATAYNLGNISLNGNITSPTTFKNQSDSTTAFQVQNAAGTTLLGIDTINNQTMLNSAGKQALRVGDVTGLGRYVSIGYANATSPLSNSSAQATGFIGMSTGLLATEANFGVKATQAGFAALAVQGATGQTADLFQLQNSVGATIYSVSATGAVLAKNTVDSSTAFQVQNASGNSVINVNTAVNASIWTSTTAFTTARARGQTVTYNGKMYILGGQNSSTPRSDVQISTINGDGSLSSWTTTTPLPVAKTAFSAVAYNGYMYTLGGFDPSTNTYYNDVRMAPINGDGTIGTWSTTTSFTSLRGRLSAVAYNGYMYITGGNNASNGNGQTAVQYAPINGDGTIGTWTDTSSLAIGRFDHVSVAANGYLYVFGGYNSISDVSYAAINGNGTLGTWTVGTPLPALRQYHSGVVYNSKIYLLGGATTGGTVTNDVLSATLNNNGTVGSWTTGTGFTTARNLSGAAAYNGRLYVLGGAANLDYFGTFYNDVQYTTLTSSPYNNSITIDGLLTNAGPAVFKNTTDSTTAFQIQNAAGTSNLFVADTTNTRLAVGKSSAGYTLDVSGDINSTTAIRVGGNQVCDSTGCVTSSTSGIKNQTTTQTANMNIQSASTTQPTAVIQGANAQTADILQVKDGTSASNPLFAVNQTTSNLISNPSFEVDTAGWSPKGSATISRSTAQKLYGDASLAIAFTGANGDGATFAYNLAPATSYTLSMSVYMTAVGQYTNPIYSSDGTTQTGCATYVGTANTWQRFVCGFTTSSVSGATYIGLSKSFASAGTAYIDGVQLEAGTSGTNFQQGQISLNGVVNSQTVYRNSTNSNTAFQIQNSAGANVLIADTVNSRICIASCQSSTPAMILDGSGLNFSNISNSSTKITQTNNGLQFGIGNGGFSGVQIAGNSGYTGNLFNIQSGANSSAILNVTQNNANLLVNPSFDTNTTGWTNLNSTTLTRTTAETYSGPAGLAVGPTAATGDGVRQSYSLATNTNYAFSFYVKGTSAFSTLEAGYVVGSTYTSCATAQAVTTGWNRISCTFTTPASWGGTPSMYVRQTDATARTFYVDAFQLETGSVRTNYSLGNISLNGTVTSPSVFQNQSNSTTAFQVQNAAGAALINVDTTTFNQASNASFETGTTGWSAAGAAVLSRSTAQKYIGTSSMGITLVTPTNDGARLPVSLSSSTAYTLSFYAMSSSAGYGNIQFGRSDDGSTDTNCSSNAYALNNSSWQKLTCTFTTGTVSGSPYIYIRASGGAAITIYVDAVQVEAAASATSAFQEGTISLNGVINSPVALRNQSNSTTAFSIQNAAGTTQMTFDTTGTGALNIYNSANRALTISNSKISNTSSTLQLEATSGNMVEIVNSGSSESFPAFKVTGSAAAAVQAQIKGAAAQTADIFQVQGGNSTSAILSVAQNNTNLISNPSFDLNTNGWSNFASTSASRITSDQYSGRGSMLISASAANSGMSFSYALAASATYSFSTYVKSSAEFSTYELGYTNNGSTFTSCATGQTVSSSWTRVSCTFTMSGAVSGSRFVYFRQTDATSRSFLVDATQLELASAPTNYSLGSLSLNGSINGPALFQNTSDSTSAFSVQNSSAASIFQVDTANSRVGIGNARPGNLLSVGALTLADPDAQLAVGTGGDSKKGIVIQAVAGQTADFFQAQDSTGAVLASIDPEGNLAVRNVTVSGHIISAGPVPTMELVGTATGTAPLSQIFGTDVAGVVVLAADVDGTGSGAFIHVTFAEQYTGIPMVVLTPSSEDAAILTGSSAVYAYGDPDGAGFTIAVGPGGLPTNVPYAWTYHVIQ